MRFALVPWRLCHDLDTVGNHRLNQDALDCAGWFRSLCAGDDVVVGVAHGVGVPEIQLDATNVGLVRDVVRRQLGGNRETDHMARAMR